MTSPTAAAPVTGPTTNRLVLSAQLVERGAVRYTPAGLPALDLSLMHESTVSEDGQPRKVSLEIRAVAIGQITRQLQSLAIGSAGTFAGFLSAGRNKRGLLFHVTALELTAPAFCSSPD